MLHPDIPEQGLETVEGVDYTNLTAHVDQEPSNCYEVFEATLENTRSRIRFWIEGVGVFAVGMVGFPCNLITVLVLRRYRVHRKNRNFHILIMWLVGK